MKKIRVLIADDSATIRAALAALLAEDAAIEVVGEAKDGQEAVELSRTLLPDVIAMDVNMPRLDGLRATEAIMAEAPARVLVISAIGENRQVDLSLRAIAAGALEVIAKPRGGLDELRAWGRRVAESVRLMAEVPVVRRHPRSTSPLAASLGHAGSVDCIGIVASTGGPPALAQVLKDVPDDLAAPVLVAQHIADGFTAGLARWLASVGHLRVSIARTGTKPLSGHLYLPPDGRDLIVDGEGLLAVPPSDGLHCPSGDKLLRSLAEKFGARSAGFVLTGMGDDGAQGLLAIRKAGGATFAQDEGSSVVFGMPKAAHACGGARVFLALENIAPALIELSRKAWT